MIVSKIYPISGVIPDLDGVLKLANEVLRNALDEFVQSFTGFGFGIGHGLEKETSFESFLERGELAVG
jgi:hypothetical protein